MLIEFGLHCGEALIPYRRCYENGIALKQGLELLALNIHNRRSLIYQLERLEEHVAELPNAQDHLSKESKLLLEETAALKLSDVNNLAISENAMREELDQILAQIQYLVSDFGKEISLRYFDHMQSSRPLVKKIEWQDQL